MPDTFVPLDQYHNDCNTCDPLYTEKRPYEIKLSDTRLIFPATEVAEISDIKKIRITNVGYESLRIDSLTIVGDFIAAMDYLGPLAPGKYYEVSIQFTPKLVGRITGGLYVDTGNAAGPEFIMLAGVGGDSNDPDIQAIYDNDLSLQEFIWIDDKLDTLVNVTIPSHDY